MTSDPAFVILQISLEFVRTVSSDLTIYLGCRWVNDEQQAGRGDE
jgi:hypothetical protein